MIVFSFPFVLVAELLSKLIKKGDNDPAISREEVSAMAEMAAEEGEFELSENKLIQNIVRLENVKVEDIMTPQVVVAMEPDTMTVEELYKDKDALHFARIPVYKDDDEDKVTGYVLRQDVMDCIANDQFSTTLKSLQRHIVAVKEGHVITRLWETLIRNKEHIAVVVDEYGSVLGIVTLEDIIETIFGMEIIDETDKVEDMQKYAREEWEKRQKEENMETIEEQIEQEEEKLKESVISQVSSEGGKTEETKADKESRNNW
jgi:CBS domain containing-hemolysin-like protein